MPDHSRFAKSRDRERRPQLNHRRKGCRKQACGCHDKQMAGTPRCGVRSAQRAAPTGYAGKTVESVTSLSMVCLRTSSTVAPTFDRSRSTIQTCCPCSNEPRVMTLSKTPSSSTGLSSPRQRPSLPCRMGRWSQQINSPKRSRPVRAQARFGRRLSRV